MAGGEAYRPLENERNLRNKKAGEWGDCSESDGSMLSAPAPAKLNSQSQVAINSPEHTSSGSDEDDAEEEHQQSNVSEEESKQGDHLQLNQDNLRIPI